MNTPYFHVLPLAVQSSVAVSRTRDHETYTEKGEYVIFEQKCTESYRVLGPVVSTGP